MNPIRAFETGRRGAWRAALFAALCLAALPGRSHDSWLSPARGVPPPGQLVLELATGNRYPVQEYSQSAASVAQAQCTDGAGASLLRPLTVQAKWLDLGTAVRPEAGAPLSCWLELAAAEIELEPARVEIYFKDIHASAAQRAAWAAIQGRGMPWRESYRKFARIELAHAGDARAARLAAARQPAGMGLEIVVLGEDPIAVGRPLQFQLLRDGRPLAGLPVELVSERSTFGIWRETDAEGKLHHTLPFAGRWLLRGTDLRQGQQADRWESRFVTLAIEAHPGQR